MRRTTRLGDRPRIHSNTMDQGGSFKMRRQLVHKTTRTNSNRNYPVHFVEYDSTINHYRSFRVRLRVICGLAMFDMMDSTGVLLGNCRWKPFSSRFFITVDTSSLASLVSAVNSKPLMISAGTLEKSSFSIRYMYRSSFREQRYI